MKANFRPQTQAHAGVQASCPPAAKRFSGMLHHKKPSISQTAAAHRRLILYIPEKLAHAFSIRRPSNSGFFSPAAVKTSFDLYSTASPALPAGPPKKRAHNNVTTISPAGLSAVRWGILQKTFSVDWERGQQEKPLPGKYLSPGWTAKTVDAGSDSPATRMMTEITTKTEDRGKKKAKVSGHLWRPSLWAKSEVRRKWHKNTCSVNMSKQMGRERESGDGRILGANLGARRVRKEGREKVPNDTELLSDTRYLRGVLKLVPTSYQADEVRLDLYNRKQEALKIFHRTRSTTAPFLGFLQVGNLAASVKSPQHNNNNAN